MSRAGTVAAARAAFAALAIAAITTQAVSLSQRGVFNPVNYFSYFTIDSNLIAVALLLIGAISFSKHPSHPVDVARGGAVVYMTVTGVVFTLLLSGTDVDTTIRWVNTVVHELMPMVIIADWLLMPPRRLRATESLIWFAFPLLWITYTLIRGAATGWYPYPFLDPRNGGYGSVAAYIVAIIAFMACLIALVAWLGRHQLVPQEVDRNIV